MKKIIMAGLIVLAGGLLVQLTQIEEKKTIQIQELRREQVYIQKPFGRNEAANGLIEYVNSLRDKQRETNKEVYMNGDREGGIVEIALHEVDAPIYLEVVEKIERVLKLDGLTDFIYGEESIQAEQEALERVGDWESVRRIKMYQDVLVEMRCQKRPEFLPGEERARAAERTLTVKIPQEPVKDTDYIALTGALKSEDYYLKDLMVGGEKQMVILGNSADLLDINQIDAVLDETSEMIEEKPVGIRYEILADKGKMESVRVILKGEETFQLEETDLQMLIKVAQLLGLDEMQAKQFEQLVQIGCENNGKEQKEKIGGWEYRSQFTQESYGAGKMKRYLMIDLQ